MAAPKSRSHYILRAVLLAIAAVAMTYTLIMLGLAVGVATFFATPIIIVLSLVTLMVGMMLAYNLIKTVNPARWHVELAFHHDDLDDLGKISSKAIDNRNRKQLKLQTLFHGLVFLILVALSTLLLVMGPGFLGGGLLGLPALTVGMQIAVYAFVAIIITLALVQGLKALSTTIKGRLLSPSAATFNIDYYLVPTLNALASLLTLTTVVLMSYYLALTIGLLNPVTIAVFIFSAALALFSLVTIVQTIKLLTKMKQSMDLKIDMSDESLESPPSPLFQQTIQAEAIHRPIKGNQSPWQPIIKVLSSEYDSKSEFVMARFKALDKLTNEQLGAILEKANNGGPTSFEGKLFRIHSILQKQSSTLLEAVTALEHEYLAAQKSAESSNKLKP